MRVGLPLSGGRLRWRRGTDRPALPRRAIVEATGLGERAVRSALARLDAAGLLQLEESGAPGGPKAKNRRAALYRLGAVPVAAATTETAPPPTDTEDTQMATITIDLHTLTPEQRDAVLAALGRTPAAGMLPANVVPLRRPA